MKYLKDGTPISYSALINNKAATALSKEEINAVRRLLDEALEIHLATVLEILYTDDKRNKSSTQTEYIIRIETGARRGQEFGNVQVRDIFGGVVNFQEIIYTPKAQILEGNKSDKNVIHQRHDATQVIVGFLDGASNLPVILTGFTHSTKVANFSAKKADGIRLLQEFNGIREEINKDGEYLLTYFGGPRNTKPEKKGKDDPVGFNKAIRPETAPTIMKFDKTGAFSLSDKENQQFKVDRVTKKISITQNTEIVADELPPDQKAEAKATKLINSIELDKTNEKITLISGQETKVKQEIDGKNEKVVITFKTGMIITADGVGDKVTIVTKGGAQVLVDGTADQIMLKDKAGGELNVKAGKVALGASSAELLQQISDSLQKMITWANTVGAVHTHIGNLGYPTAPPDLAAQYTQLGTDLTTIKGKVDGIKGTL